VGGERFVEQVSFEREVRSWP